MREKPCQSPGRMKNSSYYIAPVGVRTHDLPHTVDSNMGQGVLLLINTSKEPVCPRVELILKIIIILLIIFLGFIKSKPC